MNRFVPREKLSTKAKKELAARQRVLWETSPASRRIESKKLYNRKKRSRVRWDDPDTGASFLLLRLRPERRPSH